MLLIDFKIHCKLYNLHNNQLSQVDVGLDSLKQLTIGFNQLTSLDVSKCLNLERLWCAGNQLMSLDLSSNSHLK